MYSSYDYQYLVSCVLLGDKFALEELIKRHRKYGCLLNPQNSKRTPLLQNLIQNGKIESAIFLLDNLDDKAEVNKQDKLGNTPLHKAVTNGDTILIEKLLEKGANPFICNEDGMTAGMLAEKNGHKDLAFRLSPRFLLKYPNLNYIYFFSCQSNENQDKPLDLSKTAPNIINSEPIFFKPNKPSRLFPAEEVTIEIDPTFVFWTQRCCS